MQSKCLFLTFFLLSNDISPVLSGISFHDLHFSGLDHLAILLGQSSTVLVHYLDPEVSIQQKAFFNKLTVNASKSITDNTQLCCFMCTIKTAITLNTKMPQAETSVLVKCNKTSE